jgi:hypothetical protein
LLDGKLSLLFISELLAVVSKGVGGLFIVLPDFLCNRSNQDISLRFAGDENSLRTLLLVRRPLGGQSGKRSSAGEFLRFFFFFPFAVFFFLGLHIHLWNDFSSCLFGKT